MTRGLVSYLCRVMLNKLEYVGCVTRLGRKKTEIDR
jgi:hypothetical protein